MASAETVVLTLQEQISGPAAAAEGGLSLLERKILQSQQAIARLEQAHARAAAQLAATTAGDQGFVDVAAYRKQEAAVATLAGRIESAKQRIMYVTEQQAAKEQAAADKAAAAAQAAADRQMAIAVAAAASAEAAADRKAAAEAAASSRAAAQAEAAAERKAAAEEAAASKAAAAAQKAADQEIAAAKKSAEEQIKKTEEARQKQRQQNEAIVQTGQAFLRLLGPVGEQVNKFIELGRAIAKLPPELQIVAVAILAAGAALAVIGKFFAEGIEASGKYRDELLKLQGAVGGNAEAAKELQGAITQVASGSALARDKITDLAGQLARAGLQGAELRNALEAAAIASSAGGDQMASDFIKAAEAAKKAGGNVDELSKAMKDKLGGIAAAQALAFGVQIDKLKENLTNLFSGADIAPLLDAMHALLSIFDATTAEGQAMRAAIGSAIESLIGVVLKLATMMVNAYTAIKSNAVAWAGVKMAAMGVVAALVFVAAVVGVIIAIMGAAWGVITMVWGAIAYIGMAVVNGLSAVGSFLYEYLIQPFVDAYNALSSFSLADVGSNMINGLIGGIKGAAGAFVSSIVGVAKSGVQAAKAALGIASPSKVFADIGLNTGAGMVQGVDASTDSVQASTEGLADAAVTGATAGKKAAGALGAKGGASTGFAPTFSNCNFVGTTQREVEAMMRAVFEAEYLDAGAVA